MKNYRQLITEYGFDIDVWKRYYYQHQIDYIRQCLWVVRHFSEGMSSSKSVVRSVGCFSLTYF